MVSWCYLSSIQLEAVVIITVVVVVDTLHSPASTWGDQALMWDLSGPSPTLRP